MDDPSGAVLYYNHYRNRCFVLTYPDLLRKGFAVPKPFPLAGGDPNWASERHYTINNIVVSQLSQKGALGLGEAWTGS